MKHAVPMLTDTDMRHLRRCVELATDALEAGDEPFGSVLVGADGTVLGEDHNHVAGGDRTRHPEQLAAWLSELGVPEPPVRTLPIQAIVPGAVVEGPVDGLAEQVHELHRRFFA
jgi:hypothetical protein